MDQVRRSLGRRVRALRLGLGLSQEGLAEKADLHWTHISGIERGQYDLKLSTLSRVANAFGMTLSDLFSGVGPARSRPTAKR